MMTGKSLAVPQSRPCTETLLLINVEVVNGEGVLIVRSIWATTSDRHGGHRRTDVETVDSLATFLARMAELAPAICWQPDELSTGTPP